MPPIQLTDEVKAQIERAVAAYLPLRTEYANLSKRLESELVTKDQLKRLIHSSKSREKDPEHLRDKLTRKAEEAMEKGKPFTITEVNLFDEVDDLAGVRLLHIRREQLREIDPIIRKILELHHYRFREKAKAFTWDIENSKYYKELGFRVETNPKFYTSVHYVIESPAGALGYKIKMGCELQVRTLAEELWREVSHTVNYPHESKSIACVEQLAVLARVASGCTRLVDSIFASAVEFEQLTELAQANHPVQIVQQPAAPAPVVAPPSAPAQDPRESP